MENTRRKRSTIETRRIDMERAKEVATNESAKLKKARDEKTERLRALRLRQSNVQDTEPGSVS